MHGLHWQFSNQVLEKTRNREHLGEARQVQSHAGVTARGGESSGEDGK